MGEGVRDTRTVVYRHDTASTYSGFILNQVDDALHHTTHQSVAYKISDLLIVTNKYYVYLKEEHNLWQISYL